MERDFGKEIDRIQRELDAVKARLSHEEQIPENPKVGKVFKMPTMHKDPNIMGILDQLENMTGEKDETGAISYVGVYSSGGRQSTWIRHMISTDGLLKLIADKTAEQVLACIGSQERLDILLVILKKPSTVNEIVKKCKFNTTGQAYHHMKPLLAAGIIVKEEGSKGVYIVSPRKVQGLIMLLAGICDIVDESNYMEEDQ